MTNFNFSVTTSLSGERIKSAFGGEPDSISEGQYELGSSGNNMYRGIYEEKEADFSVPWDISLTYNYTQNQEIPTNKTKFSNIAGGLNFNLTQELENFFYRELRPDK